MATRKQRRPARKAVDIEQGIESYFHSVGNFVEVTYAEGKTVDGKFVPDVQTRRVERITKAAYASLMSASPSWAPGKPAGIFRAGDLFALLDYMQDDPEEFREKIEIVSTTEEPAATAEGK